MSDLLGVSIENRKVWYFLQGGMLFLIQVFCATRYTLVVYGKNCLGDVAMVYNHEKYYSHFALQILPKSASTYLESVNYIHIVIL